MGVARGTERRPRPSAPLRTAVLAVAVLAALAGGNAGGSLDPVRQSLSIDHPGVGALDLRVEGATFRR